MPFVILLYLLVMHGRLAPGLETELVPVAKPANVRQFTSPKLDNFTGFPTVSFVTP